MPIDSNYTRINLVKRSLATTTRHIDSTVPGIGVHVGMRGQKSPTMAWVIS